ncbi:MAG TPA: HlyD family secretion protein [Dokdonella sp.]
MNRIVRSAIGLPVTALAVAAAIVVATHLWRYYTGAPWTRDAHIRADVVQVAADVSGPITQVNAVDNQQVSRGQPLFVVDQARYTLALRHAEAALAERKAALAQLRREDARNRALRDLIAKETVEEGRAKVEQAEAALATAEAAVDVAKLDLERTVVRSPVDGFLGDRMVRVGDYVAAGRAVLSVVDSASYRVEGYFEETRLGAMHVGQAASIRVMGESRLLHGHVQSIAAGIEDRDRTDGRNLLPDVNPAFNWVRLAQRIPVRIGFDEPPADLRLIAGRIATVAIEVEPASRAPRAAAVPGETP